MPSPLGRGLASLIPAARQPASVSSSAATTPTESVILVPVGEVHPNPQQPRQEFDEQRLQELAASIKEHGILSPLLVSADAPGYALIAGERRWRAAKMAGLHVVPCIVRSADELARMTQAIVENVQRADLNPIEEAMAYKKLMDEFDLTQQDVAQRVGKARASVANCLRLLALPQPMIAAIAAGRISAGHAKVLLGLQPSEQAAYFQRIVQEKLSVRALEQEIAATTLVRAHARHRRSPDIEALERQLREKLGTQVRISDRLISLRFTTSAELRAIAERLLRASQGQV